MFDSLSCSMTVLVAGLVMAMAGCGKGTVRSVVSTTIQGRRVVASIDGPGAITSSANNDAAIISFAGKRVVVEKEQVFVDGNLRATVPGDASRVEITYLQGTLTVTADGKEVLKSAL